MADLKEAHVLATADPSRKTFHSFSAELSSVGAAVGGKQVRQSPSYRSVPLSNSPKRCYYKKKCMAGKRNRYSTRSEKERQKQESIRHPTLASVMHRRRC